MAKYLITSPDGQKYNVSAPDDASQDDVLAYAQKQFKMAKAAPAKKEPVYDPTDGMGEFDKFAAGAGKAVADLGRSVGQGVRWASPQMADAMGAPTQADIDESRKRDVALMNTGAGMAGNIGGNLAMALMPGTGQIGAANKINQLWAAGGAARAASLGAAAGMGAAQNAVFNPRASEDSLGEQVAGGAVMGAVGQTVGPLLSAGAQGVRKMRAGSMGTVGRTLQDFAGVDPATLAQTIRLGNRELVAGSAPTTVQATQNAGLARLKSAIRGMYPNEFAGVDAAQNTARLAALDGIAPGASGRTAIEAAENAGDVLGQEAALHRDTLKGLVSEQYNHPSLSTARIALPFKDSAMGVLSEFYPGKAMGADEASRALAAFASRLDSGEPIPLKEFDALRKIAGNKATDLRDSDRTAAAAWSSLKGLFNDAEGAAIAKSGDKFAVTGQGPWGPQFGNLAGDPENSIAHLLRMGRGEVPSAATNQMAGPVGFVAGNPVKEGPGAFGLLHIDAQGRDDVLRNLPKLASDGIPYSRLQESKKGLQAKGGRKEWFYLGDGDQEALIRGDFNFKPTDKPWSHTAYRIDADKKLPVGTAQLSSANGFTTSAQTPMSTTGDFSLPDIDAAFKAFDESLQPPVVQRDPRQYVGGLLAPDQAQHLQAGRTLHGKMMDRFNTGPASLLTKTGSDGAPRLQGAERIKAFVNSKDSQGADIAQLRKMVLDKGPTMQAAKGYALSDLIQSATDAQGQLLPSKFGNWADRRSVMLKGLLTDGEQASLGSVADDLQRASAAAALERIPGQSNTAEKLTSFGLLDNGLTNRLLKGVTHLPYVGGLLGVGMDGMGEAAKHWKYRDVPGALVDPKKALEALQVQESLMRQNLFQRGLLSPRVQQGMVPLLTSGD